MRCLLRVVALFVVGFAMCGPVASAADINQARDLFRQGKYEEVIAQADETLRGNLVTESWFDLKAQSQFRLGKFADSWSTIEAGLQRIPTSIRLRYLGMQVGPYAGRDDDPRIVASQIATMVQSSAWNYTDVENLVTLAQFLLGQGADPKQVKDGFIERARRNNPTHRLPLITSGNLALDKRDFALAADIFRPALELIPNDPDLMFGLARALEGSDPQKMGELVEATLKENPRHEGALLLKADRLLDGERYPEALETLGLITAFNPKHPEALALKSVIATLQSDPDNGLKLRDEALSSWSRNPLVDHVIGRELSQKYRFAEGAAAQRQALAFDRQYLPAKKQLMQDLMRLGREEEGWRLADEVYRQDQFDVATYNLVTLRSELAKFVTIDEEGFEIRMDAHEAEVYGERVVKLLAEARRVLCAKYHVELPQETLVEIFPRPSDFAVRTFGMPGAAGYLGVCFGNVITANSPASQQSRPVNWESVLWHEFTHVVTLNKTHNRMPRWLSEGISVYEERLREPSWGERMTPVYRDMILNDQLAPIGELSNSFMTPPTPTHLMFAYFESSLVVEYIVANYGLDAIIKILDDLAIGMHVNEAIARHTAPLPELDDGFKTYVVKLANDYGSDVDWKTPDVAPLAAGASDPDVVIAWADQNAKSYAGQKLAAEALIRLGRMEDAKRVLERAVALFDLETGADSAWALLAAVRKNLGDEAGERDALQHLAKIDDDAAAALLRLLEIDIAKENWEAVRENALKLVAIKPLIPQTHTALARASEALQDRDQSILALRGVLAMDPPDKADVNYRLAVQLHQQKELPEAKRHVLQALEQAPRYRAALGLLLQVSADMSVIEIPPSPSLPEPLEGNAPAQPAPPEGVIIQ